MLLYCWQLTKNLVDKWQLILYYQVAQLISRCQAPLVKNPARARKFLEWAMPEMPVPEKFEKGHAKNARARKMCARSHH